MGERERPWALEVSLAARIAGITPPTLRRVEAGGYPSGWVLHRLVGPTASTTFCVVAVDVFVDGGAGPSYEAHAYQRHKLSTIFHPLDRGIDARRRLLEVVACPLRREITLGTALECLADEAPALHAQINSTPQKRAGRRVVVARP